MNKQKYPVRNYSNRAGAFSAEDLKIEIDGMKVVLEKKIVLLPVNVTEKKNGAGKPI